jgi:hypothetical protein
LLAALLLLCSSSCTTFHRIKLESCRLKAAPILDRPDNEIHGWRAWVTALDGAEVKVTCKYEIPL